MTGSEPAWTRLFPDEDFAFRFGFTNCPPADFFGASPRGDALLQERNRWLDESAGRYCGLLPAGDDLLAETLELAGEWGTVTTDASRVADTERCSWLGRRWEPDFLLLRPGGASMRLEGGCVCFPSSWDLAEKIGRELPAIHAPVPGLNEGLGTAIDRFLSRLRPGTTALRANWGLSRSPELNQHPMRRLPRLQPPVAADKVFLRIENQALVALPKSGGLLFGIRLEVIPLADVMGCPTAAAGLRRALRTMPAAVAAYKNLDTVRDAVGELLQSALTGSSSV